MHHRNEHKTYHYRNSGDGGFTYVLKIKIIQKVDTHISDLSNIEDIEIKKQLLTNLKVVTNWKNVIDYYTNCENKIDEKLIEFLNSEIERFSLKNLSEKCIHRQA